MPDDRTPVGVYPNIVFRRQPVKDCPMPDQGYAGEDGDQPAPLDDNPNNTHTD